MKMFNLLERINDVKSISINELRTLYVLKDGHIFKDTELLYIGKDYCFATNFINKVFWHYGDKNNRFLFLKDTQLDLSNYSTNTFSEKGAIVFKNRRITDVIKADFYFHSFENNSEKLIISDFIGGPVLVYSNNTKSIFRNINKLSFFSLVTGEYEWELDLGERITLLGSQKIEKIIGVHNDILWVSCDKALFGIAISSGEVKHQITEPTRIAYQSGELEYFRGYDGNIDQVTGILYGIEHETYYELDLQSLELSYWIFADESKKLACNAPHFHGKAFEKNDIFFIDKMNATIGSFNRQSKTWSLAYSFSVSLIRDNPDLYGVRVGLLNDIQTDDNKIYALTTEGYLFIFEKEEVSY